MTKKTVTVKIEQLVECDMVLRTLLGKAFEPRLAYQIGRNARAIKSHTQVYTNDMRAFMEKHGAEILPGGRLVLPSDHDTQIKVETKDREWLQTEIEVEIIPIELEELLRSEVSMQPGLFSECDFIIADEARRKQPRPKKLK